MKERTSLARWTPRRLLSLLMALIMTLSLLPTAALAATISGPYTLDVADAPTDLIVGQESADITANLTSTDTTPVDVRLKVTVTPVPGAEIKRYDTATSAYVTTTDYLDDGATYPSVSSTLPPVSADFKLSFNAAGSYTVKVEAVRVDATGETSLVEDDSMTITVKDAIDKLTVDPAEPEAGQPFTVRADTNVNSGYVVFEYNGALVSAPVNPLSENEGYAEYKDLIAVAGVTEVKATLRGATGSILGTKTTPFTLATPATYHTVVFRANGDNVYSLPEPQTVKSGASATKPAFTPERKGYTFGGWCDSTGAAYDFTTNTVTTDLELYAMWTATPVTVTFPAATDLPAGVQIFPIGGSISSSVGSVVHFNVRVPDKYNTADLLVHAGHFGLTYRMLVPVARVEAADGVTLYYQFAVEEDLVDPATSKLDVTVSNFIEKTFTVMMPTGHFTAQITSVSGTAQAAGTTFANVEHGGSYTFTVTPDNGYTVKRVAVNGATINENTAGSYTVPNVTTAQTVEVVVDELPVYIVIYNSNNSQYAFQRVTEGSKATLPADPVVEGYTFGGWYTDQNGAGTPFTDSTDITGDITVYAKLTPKLYTIKYDLNSGTDTTAPTAIADQSKTHGLAEKLSETVPTREGFTFLGWGTAANATAASYQPGDMYSVDKDITLFAVWQKNTYTITFSSGEGYSLHSIGSMTVAHGENFEFNLFVDPAHAQNKPTVYVNTGSIHAQKLDPDHAAGSDAPTNDGAKVYHYKLENVTANTAINAEVTANTTYTVTFMTGTDVYQTQQVEFNHKATQPVDPKVEGFTFGGWYREDTFATAWDFATDKVIENTTLYAKLDPITPEITWPSPTTGYTMKVEYTAPGAATATPVELTTNPGTVPYNSVVTFTITISKGYDASKMKVGINGVLLSPTDITGDTYTFEFTAKENTNITVVGVERKTITITYYDNARDDTSNPLAPQIANYYVENAADNSTFTKQAPVRTGYTFLGWSTDGTAKEATYKWADINSVGGLTIKFTKDTALYAIWTADALTAELIITDEFTSAGSTTSVGGKLEYAYEGDSITLVGKLSADAQGTMTFYKKAKTATDWTFLGTTSINGGNYGVLGTTVENYKWGNADDTTTKNNYRWEYKVEFKPTTDEGYSPCGASDDLRVYSKAISWEVDKKTDTTTYNWTNAKNTLTIYTNGARTTTTDKMTANSTYWLQIPAVYELDGGLNLKNNKITKLSVGTHYEITWEYEDSANHWTEYTTTSDTDWVKVTPDYSGYSFRAKVTPTQSSIYTKAATYDENGTVVKDVYWDYLITKATAKTEKQGTTTALEITGADDEAANVTINGNTPFNTTGDHKAQFEGQKVTLTATVKDTTANVGVKSGEVKFFRYVDGTSDELLNTTLISVDSNGVATCEVTISNWDTTQTAANNKDQFYAVYQPNATYDTSNSKADLKAVYIKSTAIKTPIIESKLEGEGSKKATTYNDNLTGLLAGVQHEFKLRTGNAEPDWSVVALDGRTVAAENYDIEWQYKQNKTNDNFAKAGNDSTAEIYTTKTTEVGDQYRVVLKAKGDMKTDATSKVAEIGKKQDVTVTVEASDEINSTAETDVYQLNKITLTATVAAKETSSTMKPTGTVTFYYSVDNGTTWTKIGDTKDLAETAGSMTASITTKELPVTAGTNTKQNVEITAVYEGNDTFAVSGNYNETSKEVSAGSPANGVFDKTVTVYSSVVYVDSAENTTNTPGAHGIAITTEDGKVLANETNVNLKLSDVYTLDHGNATVGSVDLSKLTYNTDYTVQWQKLTNAAAYPDKASATWENITSATGTTCQIDVEHGAAYRAVITVNDTPIAKGSYEKIDQGTVGTADKNDGRQVYYSNILVAANAPATLTVNVNTDNTSKGYEGIVEGETVTIHTFTSGATGTTPISQLTVNIYEGKSPAAGATPVFTAEKANVNGHVSFDWNKDVTPGYYTLKVKATFTNGYDDKEITRTLIVRDNDYSFNVTGDNAVYNGKVQGLNVAVQNMGIENALAQKSVVVYYYTDEARTQQVEPTQAGTYYATVRLQESAYWTEKTLETTFTIKPRPVEVVDLVAQAKVYDGTTNANIQEIILNDAEVNSTTGLPTDDKGIIDGDSVYAVGTGYTSKATAGTADLGVKNVTLMGDDAANYDLTSYSHTEKFNIQRSQVKGAIVSGRTYKYTGKDIKLAASDIYLIDQAGSQLTDYDVTYYYHNGDGVEKVDAMNKMGKYTVIARPEQNNYKGGATETVYVGTTDNAGTLDKSAVSSLITISNTVELYGAAGNKGIVATATNNATVTVQYQNGTGWSDARPTDAGRYLVKVTATNGSVTDTAYGIYTIVKARPEFTPTTDKSSMEYTSGRYDGAIGAGFVNGKSNDTAETYITYTGGTIQGVAYEAPTEVGKYIATVHVGETANYTAHEKQVAFEITPKALTITADDISRQQYGAYPDLTASFKGLATGGVAADTSLRDVQIQPELIFDTGYTNDADDQVGNNYGLTAAAALARNYNISYQPGNLSVTREDPRQDLEIRGMIKNGDNATDLAYYGDVIQLYAYGNQNKTTTGDVYNTSSILAWSVTGPATITQDGLLTVTGVGDVTVTLTRGIGAQQIRTSLTFKAKKQEVKVVVPAEDKVYDSTTQDYTSTKTLSAVNAMGIKVFSGNDRFVIANKTRSDVGSQIVTGKVSDSIHSFQSETYGGLFTINVKDVTVTPKTATTTYGTLATGLTHSESNTVGGVPALTGPMAVSVADAYKNLDVLPEGYEILVAGKENENYNVKYVTDQTAPDVKVTPKALIIKTGTLNSDGRTSGYLKDNDQFYKNEGFAITGTTFNLLPNDRMYGEVNPVMDYTFAGFVSGDSEADFVTLLPWLVKYSDGTYHNINGNANVAFDKTKHLNGFRAASCMSGMSAYPIDSMLLANSVKNYTLTSAEATQNIYQRPVTLTVPTGVTLTAYKPTILDASDNVKMDVLLDLLLNNLVVGKYNDKGGLAELLKHTIKDLDIKIVSATYNSTAETISVTIELGNKNYWTENLSFTVTVDKTKIVAKYTSFGWTSASVTMVGVDESGHETGPVDVSGKVWYKIYVKDPSITNPKYSDYKGKTPVLNKEMFKGSSTGVYIANYDSLPAGEYVMFAIAEGYTIIE